MDVDEAALDAPLSAAVAKEQIQGPVVSHLLACLDELPTPGRDLSAQVSNMASCRTALEEALEEEVAVVGLSASIQNAATLQVKQARDALATAETACQGAPLPASSASADKARTVAVLELNAWQERVSKKQKAIKHEFDTTLDAIADARTTLCEQEVFLRARYDEHCAAWTSANDALADQSRQRIARLRELCLESPPSTADAPMAADMAELRSQMEVLREHCQARELDMQTSLAKAQEQHDGLVLENNSRFAEAIAKWENHCEALKAQLPEGSAPLMSPGEKEQRATHAATVRDQAPPCLADGAQKGGSASASADILQGALGVLRCCPICAA